jgi:hypothetical protein
MNSTVALVNVPEIPATHISINPDYSQQITRLEATLSGCPAIVTNDDCALINQLSVAARDSAKTLEARRVEAKEPFLALGRMIDAAVKPLIDRAKAITTKTDYMLMTYRRELEAKAAEQKKLQDQALEEQRQQQIKAELARRKANAPAAAPVAPPPPQPVVAAVEIPELNITTAKRQVLRIFDPTLIPQQVRSMDGQKFVLLIVNEAEVKRAIKAGCSVPGCKMVEEEYTRGK